jgi:O-antigen ligase
MVLAAAIPVAALSGLLIAGRTGLGMAIAVAAFYVPLVLTDFGLGIALWLPVIFLAGLPLLSFAPNASSVLLGVAFLGTLRAGHSAASALSAHRRLLVLLGALALWFTVTALWAADAGRVFGQAWRWWVAAITFAAVLSVACRPRGLRLLALAFIAAAALTVLVGITLPGLVPAGTDVAGQSVGRLQVGPANDPNFLAALLVPAIALAVGLAAGDRDPLIRSLLSGAAALLGVGLLATESRGGLIGAFVALAVTLVLARRRRAQIVGALAVVAAGGALWFTANPPALERVTSAGGGGNGRSDLWSIAWHMGSDHPVAGVGLDNYVVHSKDYLRTVGRLEFADLVARKKPLVAHNLYLQTFAETGVVGFALLIAFFAATLRLLLEAIRRFDALGDRTHATLARAVLAGLSGMLLADVFISNGADQRQWVLLALAPAMLVMARRAEAARSG